MHNFLQMAEESRAAFQTLKDREAPKLAQRFSPRDADLFWADGLAVRSVRLWPGHFALW